ncbi:hydantoinase B/oxoprolinase family protein [Gluconacetobacter azotocaptans]|uniref:hydantoinase B/oxoprolinase family protein n=1 Tax=Gluconacetobacter azotocaptans TaxID=142834 RepID=UPI00195F11E4|nr:hydantoinase B/oxoprolinase family protein [Gluconacetobacter azotocaptans]MBM9400761.1 hydantoinase B/oxoprolinase family protein [Gluconacetobacter azotocaptans]
MNTVNRVSLDPVTIEIIGSALSSIVDEMGEALIRTSYSTNIKERRDCSTALFDQFGHTLCQAEHIPMHLGSFIEFIPLITARYQPEEIEPGDVFIGNDAYLGGGTHLPDIVLAEPIFVGGGIVAWAINTAHHSDFADRGDAHIFQEGIRIPPIKLYRRGVLQQDVQDLILLNCQVPGERISDLRAQMAANRLGVNRFAALCGKYGVDVIISAGLALQDYAERKMRAGIAAIPDGTYTAEDMFETIDYPEPMLISCAITVSGQEMTLKFECPKQVRANFNMTRSALLATVYYAIKSIVDPTIPPNAGLTRPLHVEAEEGTILCCAPPAAVMGRISTCQRVVDVINAALAPVCPKSITAASNGSVVAATFSGTREGSNRFWIYLETIGGGSGARYNKDGLDGVQVYLTNTSNLPVEALEIEYPLTLLRYELVDGSGGAGRFRGGMGLRRVYRAEENCAVDISMSRMSTAPWGLDGGGEGGMATVRCTAPIARGRASLAPADVVEIVTPGAGGYGRPDEA